MNIGFLLVIIKNDILQDYIDLMYNEINEATDISTQRHLENVWNYFTIHYTSKEEHHRYISSRLRDFPDIWRGVRNHIVEVFK